MLDATAVGVPAAAAPGVGAAAETADALEPLVTRQLRDFSYNPGTAVRVGLMASLATLLFSGAFFHAYGDPLILVWAAAALLPHLVGLRLSRSLPADAADARLAQVLGLFFLNTIALATIHAVGVLLFFRRGEHVMNGILVLWYAMLIGAAAARPFAEKRMLIAFTTPVGTALAVGLCFGGTPTYWLTAAAVLLYTAAQTAAGLDAHALRAGAMRQSVLNQRLARRLDQQVQVAERAAKEKSRFLAAASHDLRQPAHAIALLCDALRNKHAAMVGTGEFALLASSVQELNASLDAMLDISRLDAGVVDVNLERVDLSSVFAVLHKRFLGRANAKGLGLRFRAAGAHVLADRQLLVRLLGNLVDNALKYTNRGGVLVAVRGAGEAFRIEVRDSGVGITRELHERVFDEFFQADNHAREREQGIGLGLSIVRRLAVQMNMELHLCSEPGRGSCFRLQCRRVAEHAAAPTGPSPAPAAPSGDLRGRHVLVVDNESAIRSAAGALLASYGATVHEAQGGRDAMAILESATPLDLAIVDYRLGGEEDGLELSRAITGIRRVPVLIVTGDTAPSDSLRLRDAGVAVAFKPLTGEGLVAAVRRAIGSPGGAVS